ncbi:MAG TPA: tryptophan--tRNA ligase [Candidatus Korarchaeota archaeon]|nr:tryptophan--tRNA ligase [Candidatus Korarchaeota archaeon]
MVAFGRRDESEPVFSVTPYEVSGEVDYDRLIRQFGFKTINENLLNRLASLAGDLHPLLTRGVFFAHRDLDVLLDTVERGGEFYLYTGRGPSGHVHIGHMVPWVLTKWLQDRFKVRLYFQLTDDEKFLHRREMRLSEARSMAVENALDIAALGFNPELTLIFRDTDLIRVLYPVALKVAKRLTLSTVKAAFGFSDETNVGLTFFTSIQAAPAFLESELKGRPVPCLVPLAVDQDPHFRLARDVAPKLGYPKPSILHSRILRGLRGEAKMSSSDPRSAVFTTDSPDEARRKIMAAFTGGRPTVREQRELGGNPSNCAVFEYFRALFEPSDRRLEERRLACVSGNLICGECKAELAERVTKFLVEHQRKREAVRDMLDRFMDPAKFGL